MVKKILELLYVLKAQNGYSGASNNLICHLLVSFLVWFYFVITINVLFCRPLLIHENLIKCLIFARKNNLFHTSELFFRMNVEIYLFRSLSLTGFVGRIENLHFS